MAKSIQQIEQDLQNLEETVAEFTQELKSLYSEYIEQLGQGTRQQLILASYQLCTQIYPDSFLRLSLKQREKLQQSLRSLGKDLESSLLKSLENREQLEEESDLNIVEEIIKNLPISEEPKEEDKIANELEVAETDEKARYPSEEAKEIINQLQSLSSELNKIEPQENNNPNNPESLIRWQQKIEFKIKKSLDSISREANKFMQDAQIIPNRLPNKVLDVAIQAESSGSSSSRFNHLANILNLAIETEKDKQQKPTRAIQISLLRLRLSEIEFANASLNAQRTQIRNLLKQVHKIRQHYYNLQKEYAKVQAEAAWRSSWYED
ncbi:MAG: hypothetical protein AB4206_11695 [Xenococcaceae cyanobacterium]